MNEVLDTSTPLFTPAQMQRMANTAALARREAVRKLGISPVKGLFGAEVPLGTVKAPIDYVPDNVMPYVEMTNLKPEATSADIQALCASAIDKGACGVCVNGFYLHQVADLLEGTGLLPVGVVGFPLGAASVEAIAEEARILYLDGAREVDMVMNVGPLVEGKLEEVFHQISAVVKAVDRIPVKVILETCKLTDRQIALATAIAVVAGARFVKTSTGFAMTKRSDAPHIGATPKAVALMRLTGGDAVGIKASAGIKTATQADQMLRAGATRIGTSGLA